MNYSTKVKIGKWDEERKTYVKHCYNHTTTYSNDYTPKPLTARDVNLVWDIKLLTEVSIHTNIMQIKINIIKAKI